MTKENFSIHSVKDSAEYISRWKTTCDAIQAFAENGGSRFTTDESLGEIFGNSDKGFLFNLEDIKALEREKADPVYQKRLERGNDLLIKYTHEQDPEKKEKLHEDIRHILNACQEFRKIYFSKDCLFFGKESRKDD